LLVSPASIATVTLALHDALPIFHHLTGGGLNDMKLPGTRAPGKVSFGGIWPPAGDKEVATVRGERDGVGVPVYRDFRLNLPGFQDRKSTRLNSSHVKISYAVFCL